MPANLPAFAFDWYDGTSGWEPDAGVDALTLERLEGTDRVLISGTSERVLWGETHDVFRPGELLVEGATHELTWSGCAFAGTSVTSYSVGPAMPLPAGEASLAAHTEAIVIGGDYLDRFEWVVELTVTGADLEAWNDLLDMTLLDPVWTAGRAEGATARFRIPLACEGYPGSLGPGTHLTHAAVRDLGFRDILTASADLEASCTGPTFIDAETGRTLTPDEAALVRRRPDAGPPFDGGARLDAGARDAGGSFDASPGEPARGSCSASRVGVRAPWWLALGLLALRRRRSGLVVGGRVAG